MPKIASRLKEPSTWAGISILAALFGVPAPMLEAIPTIAAAIAAIAAIAMPESTK